MEHGKGVLARTPSHLSRSHQLPYARAVVMEEAGMAKVLVAMVTAVGVGG